MPEHKLERRSREAKTLTAHIDGEEKLRVSFLTAAIVALMLPLAGFAFGWALAGDFGWLPVSREEPQSTAPEGEEAPRPDNPSIPGDDVSGSDIPGLVRYPGSVRIEYLRENQGDFVWTEVEYLTDADLSLVREFYRDSFRSAEWSVNDVGFAQNAWIFFVVKDEREVFVELKPRGEIVEIDIEQTEPKEERRREETRETTDDETSSENRSDGEDEDQTPPEPASAPTPEPTPEPAAPATPDPAPAPPPAPAVYDDDFDDDDFFDDDFDDDD